MKIKYILIIFTAFAFGQNKLTTNELDLLLGSWKGTLTYLDYSTNKPYSMPANLVVSKIKNSPNYLLSNIYPDEPKANEIDTLLVKNNFLNKEKILNVIRKKGTLTIITTEKGKDGNENKPATFRHSYILSKNVFRKIKEIQFENATKWIKRHEYQYNKS